MYSPRSPLSNLVVSQEGSAKRRTDQQHIMTADGVLKQLEFDQVYQSHIIEQMTSFFSSIRDDSTLHSVPLTVRDQVTKLAAHLVSKAATEWVQLKQFIQTIWKIVEDSASDVNGQPKTKRAKFGGQQRKLAIQAALLQQIQSENWLAQWTSWLQCNSKGAEWLFNRCIENIVNILIRFRVQCVLDALAKQKDQIKYVAGYAADSDTIAIRIGKHIIQSDKATLRTYCEENSSDEVASAEEANHFNRRCGLLAILDTVSEDTETGLTIEPVVGKFFRRLEHSVSSILSCSELSQMDFKTIVSKIIQAPNLMVSWDNVFSFASARSSIVKAIAPQDKVMILATLVHRYYAVRKQHHDKVQKLNRLLFK